MQGVPSKLVRVTIIALSPLLLNALCAQAVGPATPPVTAVPVSCFFPSDQVDVITIQDPRRPVSSPIRSVSWAFRVGCARSNQAVYTFVLRQSMNEGLALTSPPPVGAPPLTFHPSPEPFTSRIDGEVHGSWCATATVELLNGEVLRTGEYLVNQSRRPAHDIAVLVSGGPNRVVPWSGSLEPCPLR
jgi:hypothetical protein